MTKNHPVVWFEVRGQDRERLQAYYGQLFGWDIQVDGSGKYGEVKPNGKGIGGGIAEQMPGARSWVTFYVAANDVAGTLEQAQRLGGKVVVPTRRIPDGPEIAVFEDPEGHVIGLVNDSPPATPA